MRVLSSPLCPPAAPVLVDISVERMVNDNAIFLNFLHAGFPYRMFASQLDLARLEGTVMLKARVYPCVRWFLAPGEV